MKLLLVVSAVLALAEAAPSGIGPVDNRRTEILSSENNNMGTGSYKFSYSQSDGQRHEQQGELRNEGREGAFVAVKGSYTWVSPNGTENVVSHVADENGFQQTVEESDEEGPGSNLSQMILLHLLGG